MSKKVKVGISVPNIKDLYKRYPNMNLASEVDTDSRPKLPSRFLAFTHQIGGGIPYGKIIEIFGEESSGKTMMANDFASVTTTLGGIVLWVDAEQSFTNEWAIKNKIDIDRVYVLPSTEVETISDWIADMSIYWRSQLVNNEPILLVLDSMASLDCMENINSKMVDAKADMGNRAKAIYKMFRIRSELLSSLGICQIYINQLRKNLKAGLFEDPDTTPGGKALAFYASIRIGAYGGKQITEKIKGKDRRIGRLTSIRIKKNKVAPPRETISKAPMYNNPKYCDEVGFDRYYGLADILIEMDIVQKSSGGSYTYKGKSICRGEEKFLAMLKENDEFRKKMLRKAGINTVTSFKAHLEKLTSNLYPVDGLSYQSQKEVDDEEE